jgi:anti-sigma factor RsiW
MTDKSVREDDLQAYVDGLLDADRRIEVEAYLEANPADAERIQAYRRHNEMLHALYDPVLEEPVPTTLKQAGQKSPWHLPVLRYAAVLGWVTLGGLVGWQLHGTESRTMLVASLPQQAAIAHVVYTPEVLHPVEVGADQEAHLVKWLSKRLGADIHPPHLADAGYQLMGGRLLPGAEGPAAQFMYQDAHGLRLTLYVRTKVKDNRETAFRYEKEGNVGVFYWLDRDIGYALSGEVDKAELLRVATAVYRQISP